MYLWTDSIHDYPWENDETGRIVRITFVCPTADMSGGNRVVSIYADRLRARGHEVSAVHLPWGTPTLRKRLRALLKHGKILRTRDPKHSHLHKKNIPTKSLDRHRYVVDSDVPDADIVVATWWLTAEMVGGLSPSKGAKFYFIQGFDRRPGQPAQRVEETYRLPMHCIAISQWLSDSLRECGRETDITLIPNSVDGEQFQTEARGKQPVPTVGFLYSPNAIKGTDIAAQAITKARETLPSLRLVAFGHGSPSADVPLQDGDTCYENAEQDALKSIYSQCDAWLFPSREEGFGLPILEAMACRTPVIATPAGAAPELVSEENGILLDTHEPQEMADAIIRLCSLEEEAWRERSDKAFVATQNYTWEDATDRFEAALYAGISEEKLAKQD